MIDPKFGMGLQTMTEFLGLTTTDQYYIAEILPIALHQMTRNVLA